MQLSVSVVTKNTAKSSIFTGFIWRTKLSLSVPFDTMPISNILILNRLSLVEELKLS